MNTNELTGLIDKTTTTILDQWTAEAASANISTDSYIGDKLDELEATEPEVSLAVGKAYMKRLGFAA